MKLDLGDLVRSDFYRRSFWRKLDACLDDDLLVFLSDDLWVNLESSLGETIWESLVESLEEDR